MSVGVLGLGIMGSAMARNVLRAGFPLTHQRPVARSGAGTGGGRSVDAGHAAAGSPPRPTCWSSMCPTRPIFRHSWMDRTGSWPARIPGLVVLAMGTHDPGAMPPIAAELASRGAAFLDAPVSGGDIGARDGHPVDHGRRGCRGPGTCPPGARSARSDHHPHRPVRGGAGRQGLQPAGRRLDHPGGRRGICPGQGLGCRPGPGARCAQGWTRRQRHPGALQPPDARGRLRARWPVTTARQGRPDRDGRGSRGGHHAARLRAGRGRVRGARRERQRRPRSLGLGHAPDDGAGWP